MSTDPAPAWLAGVGIPQGLVVDPESGEEAGAVRRGGELVSLARSDYETWLLLLTPLQPAEITEVASRRGWPDPEGAAGRLAELGLSVEIAPSAAIGAELGALRTIPLGIGVGNARDAPDEFRLQSADLSRPSPVVLDAIAVMLWWEFDGTSTLSEIVARVSPRCPDLPRSALDGVAATLVRDLMAERLLYLDSTPAPSREAR